MTVSAKIMKAGRIEQFGGPEAIKLQDVERPRPGKGELLVRVHAAGVGPWDGWIRAGRSALPQPLPLTLGSDLSGVVEMVGPDVTAFKLGDLVFGVTNPRFTGANAELAVASAAMIAKKPAEIDHVDAASLPVVAVTAWQALFLHGGLTRGQTVLIHGGAGNVGSFAVQMARRAGLQVIVTARPSDVNYLKVLGAHHVIDNRAMPLDSQVTGLDAVVNLVAGEAQDRLMGLLKPGGVLVSAVAPPDQEIAFTLGVRALFFLVDVNTAALDRIGDMVREGELATHVGTVLPLADLRRAHEMLDGKRRHPRGKIVLTIKM